MSGSTSSKVIGAGTKNHLLTTFRIVFFSISMVFKFGGPFLFILLALVTILSGFMPVVTVYVAKLVLDAIVNIVQTGADSAATRILIQALAIQLVMLLGVALLSQANGYLTYFMGKRLSLNMNTAIIKKASSLDYSFFEDAQFYDMMTRARRESSEKPLGLVLRISSLVRGGITFISTGGLIFTFSLPLFILMVIICLPLLFVQLRYGQKNYALQFDRTEDMRMAGYVSAIMMTREFLPEILSFGLWEHLFKKWYSAAQRFFQQDVQLHAKRVTTQALTGTLLTCSQVVATGYIIYVSVTRELLLTVGGIIMYSGAFARGLSGFRTALEGVAGIYEHALFLHDLVEFNKVKPRLEVRQKGKPAPITVESIELQDVSFKYPLSQTYTLRNVNVTFNGSESTLIVGANGAGKTTLIKLLARLYDPTEGRILLNGFDIRQFEIESLRRTIGIVFQEFIRYAFSAKENIGCGKIAELQDAEKIIDAAIRAKADSFIDQLPQQYDTILSKLFKNGQELSLGQWQRMCLARLFMKDAPVFVFDEPIANLDIETEAHVLRQVTRLSKNKICILVSHRLLRQGIADQIVVLDKGKVVESGTYEGLLAKNGEFTRLWKLYHNTGEREFSIEPARCDSMDELPDCKW